MNDLAMALTHALLGLLPDKVSTSFLVLLLFAVSLLLSAICILLLVKIAGLRTRRDETAKKLAASEKKALELLVHNNNQAVREARLTTQLEDERAHAAEKLQLLEDAREELRLQFSDLARQIFDEKSSRFSELNREKLESILQPFNTQLTVFKQEINDIYRHDSRERLSLKNEIVQLRDLNLQVNQEAVNLTRALKGDTRIQGNWGELVLERVLERSGLRRGIEYETQGGFRDSSNRLQKPDVLIHLPEGKDIIIDSKVSLISWEKYVNSEDEDQRSQHLAGLIKAIRDHITGLSAKNYPGLAGIHCLDFVLMFLPIEAAFSTALQKDEKLLIEALAKNIIVVTPTTLLATLRTVENIWHFEHQSKNSQEIARRAAIMYDKFRGFVEEMEKIGKQLANCHSTYDNALLKLTQGRGNLVAQAEQLKDLGIQVKKDIPSSITNLTELDLKN